MGLEPIWKIPFDFKSNAYTNSATRAGYFYFTTKSCIIIDMKSPQLKRILKALDADEDLAVLEERLKKQVNFFDILQISEMEIRHSNMLAWLFDPSQSHGLGDYFLGELYTEVTGSHGSKSLLKSFKIYREWKNIDLLLVSEKHHIVICIENKINAGESKTQLTKYRNIIEKEYPAPRYQHYFRFLTVDGHESSQPDIWQSISYEFIMDALRRTLRIYEFSLSNRAKTIIEQYLAIIERKVIGMDEETKSLVDNIYKKHQDALKLIMENVDDKLTGKTHEAVMGWLDQHLPNDFYIDKEKTIKSYIRIHSKKLDALFPNGKKPGGWDNGSKYYYEINCSADGTATFKLVFALRVLDTEKEKALVDKLFERKNSKARGTSKQWRTVQVFIPRQQMIDEDDYSLIGEDLLAKAFQQKIPAFEQQF